MAEFKPMAGCPCCGADLSTELVSIQTPDFTHSWVFQARLRCMVCRQETRIESSYDGRATAVMAYVKQLRAEEKRKAEIKALAAEIVRLVEANDFEGATKARDRMLALKSEVLDG